MIRRLADIAWITRRGLRHHAFSTAVTVFAAALASGLVMGVFSIQKQAREAFSGGPVGFDAVLGARGSELQLVLNTVFHLDTSPGNIPWSLYQEMRDDPRVELAIPYATGDNYAGFRMVGTTGEIFTRFEYAKGERFRFATGRAFEEGFAEAVLGSTVARETGLRPGDVFHPHHGVSFDPDAAHEDEYTVVGILETTNSPSDRVIWIPIEGIFHMDGHVLRGAGEEYHVHHHHGEDIPDEHKEVSAVMLAFRSPQLGFEMSMAMRRERDDATIAFPIARVMADLFDRLGWVHRVFAAVAYLVVVVSAAGILASVYNTIQARRREFAILRSIGAKRTTVFATIVGEAATIAALGALAGYVVMFVILTIARGIVLERTGVVLDAFAWHPALVATPLGMIGLGIVAGIVPAWKAYATDVATHLAPTQ